MSHWNHRVMLHRTEHETYMAIHEVYYKEDGQPDGWTSEPRAAIGYGDNALDDLRETLERMLRCLDKPVLEYSP